jgi:hypothetical protein
MTAQAIRGVLLSPSDVAEIVAAIDYLTRIAWQHRQRVPARIVALRRELAESATYAATYADLRVDAPAALKGTHFGPGVVDTATAAHDLDITEAGVRDLCRRGRLIAMKAEGSWHIARASIDDYRARNRKGA